MKRIMIIGGSGSGKSTLARKIGAAIGLPVVHIDPMYWKPGWVQRSKAETRALVLEATAAEAWVFDGNHHSTFDQRIARADTLIWLDLPTGLRMWRVVARRWQYRGQTRPDMAPDCPERLNIYFLFYWVGMYRWRARPKDVALMQSLPTHVAGVHLQSRRAVATYLARIEKGAGG